MKFSAAVHQPLLSHIKKWTACKLCPLSCSNVVFYEGTLPAKLLYLGKSPDGAAVTYGAPYPQKQDVFYDLVPQDIPDPYLGIGKYPKGYVQPKPVSWAVTYLVSCGPNEGLKKTDFTACWAKVLELITLCQPKIIICMGRDVQSFVIQNLSSVCKVALRPAILTVPDPFWIATKCSDPTLHSTNARLTIEAAVEKYL